MKESANLRKTPILALLALAQLMVVLDFSIVNVALPSIQQQFGLVPADLQWVVSAYALLFGGFLLLGGRAADLYNRKRLFLRGLVLFVLASLIGGLAPSPLVLLIARAAQGLGAAIVSPTTLALLTTTFAQGAERNRALGVFGSASGLGFSAGVILGGVLTGLLTWRWVFFVNVPLGLLTIGGALFSLPAESRQQAQGQLDLPGAVLGTGAVSSLVFALSRVEVSGAGLRQGFLFGGLALVLAVAFVKVEQRSRQQLLPLRIVRRSRLLGANLVALLGLAIGSLLAFVLTLYLQGVLGFGPLATGLAFLPSGLGGIFGGQLATWASERIGLRGAALLGLGLVVAGGIGLTRITPTGGAGWVIGGYLIVGVGIVCTLVLMSIAATASLEADLQGLAAGLLNTAQQVGAALGTSLAGIVASAVTIAVGGVPSVATTAGYQAALYLALVLAVLAGLLVMLLLRPSTSGASYTQRQIRREHQESGAGC